MGIHNYIFLMEHRKVEKIKIQKPKTEIFVMEMSKDEK